MHRADLVQKLEIFEKEDYDLILFINNTKNVAQYLDYEQ